MVAMTAPSRTQQESSIGPRKRETMKTMTNIITKKMGKITTEMMTACQPALSTTLDAIDPELSHSPVVDNEVRKGKRRTVEEKRGNKEREGGDMVLPSGEVRGDKRKAEPVQNLDGDVDFLVKFPR
jgi:hypothetical protein